MTALELQTTSPEQTREVGERLGRLLRLGDVLLLNGDLGAGKTTLTQGIAAGLGVTDFVQSPTFTLVAEYAARTGDGVPARLYHLDLYRLRDEADLESFGYEQYLAPEDGISVIEWPERAGAWLPAAYLLVDLTPAGPDTRLIRLASFNFDVDLTPLADRARHRETA